ncbi:sirohydrochlorin chelatase [Lacisediminihabitans sp. FW035]
MLDASPALVGISHGTSSPAGRSAVARLMAAVAVARPDITTASGFVDVQQPDVPQTLASLDPARDTPASAVVVPLLLSAGYHVHVDLHEAVSDRPGSTTLARALGPDPRLAELQHARLEEAGLAPDDVVVVAAAGSSDARAVAECHSAAALLATRLGRPVTVGFLSAAAPTLAEAISAARSASPGSRIVASSYLLAPGYFQSIVENSGADVATAPLLAAELPAPRQLVDIVCDRYSAALLYRAAAVLTSV